jgi:hypothetical protein
LPVHVELAFSAQWIDFASPLAILLRDAFVGKFALRRVCSGKLRGAAVMYYEVQQEHQHEDAAEGHH